MSDKKSEAKKLKDELFLNDKNAALTLSSDEISLADKFCEGYKYFINECKTERRAVKFMAEAAENAGYAKFDAKTKYYAGDKVYLVNRGKAIILAVFGKHPVADGVRISAAHIDSPRLDLKQNPLYEDKEMALLKTHYYGGIKKYQWTAIPLSLFGVICKNDGTTVEVNIGEDDDDPQFCVSDLLPHLASEQMKRTLSEGIKGEELNVLIGSRPFRDDDESELVKLNIMKILHEKYGIVEEDFRSAELELVPAFKVHDIGFDRSMIGGCGQDDRVCAYPAAMATFDTEEPEYTVVTVLTDKEEIGSDGNTGLNSSYFKYFIEDLAAMEGISGRDVLRKSTCLSADVSAAFDPDFSDAFEQRNCTYFNHGVAVMKYTGARGKSDTSDASAEFMGKIRRILNESGVCWQTGELGKVDIGGGGTVAKYIANLDVDVIDVGVPVLSMHSPFEVVAKLDVYMAYRAFFEFFRSAI